jgi:cholesterol 7alpha-monooxygenase
MLYNQNLFAEVQDEVEDAWATGQLDIKALCSNSPTLDSMLQEVLRLNNGAGALRAVTQDTTIGSKILQRGNSVMIPFKQLHINKNVWGKTVHEFEPGRFLRQKSLSRHPSYRPFGGGSTYCPGRILAKEQVFGFIAVLFRRFDIKMVSAGGHPPLFPELNTTTPSLGVNGPTKGHDVIIAISTKV